MITTECIGQKLPFFVADDAWASSLPPPAAAPGTPQPPAPSPSSFEDLLNGSIATAGDLLDQTLHERQDEGHKTYSEYVAVSVTKYSAEVHSCFCRDFIYLAIHLSSASRTMRHGNETVCYMAQFTKTTVSLKLRHWTIPTRPHCAIVS